ncbi:MFS transporter [Streptomyces sp. DSM 42041]|uniref:MFS transporter n=1 Tax=Streptomyces hazeniae TaxID=3075538 RepID=A0ABU2NLK3_9ACTN|nr:MFS transporter [Streptomyces sp. DSM 42041]MDT0377851.1 MFS transporter [Streptomyces sp. DSM 42041]
MDRGREDRAPDLAALKRHRSLFRAIDRRREPRVRRSDVTVTDERVVKRAVKAAALGNAMEWFDFGIYAYLAVTLGKVFYSGAGEGVQTLASFGTFAVSFLVRPLGGTFFGPLGDRIGRKKVLALTMMLMAAGTFAIGLIPSYATIGVWAPVLLIVCRLVQGFSTGGEYGGAATFIAEYAPDKRRGFFGSFLELGTLAGYTGAAGIVLLLTFWLGPDGMRDWGWRIPFLIGGPLGIVGLYLRIKLDETPAFRKLESEKATEHAGAAPNGSGPALSEDVPQKELKSIFVDHWRTMVQCVSLVAAYNVAHYMLLTYMPTYMKEVLDRPQSLELIATIVTMALMMTVIFRIGRRSDRVGRKPLLMAGMIGFLVLTVPAFALFQQGSNWAIFAGLFLLGGCLVCLLGTMSATLPALFSTDVRYGSLAIGYNLSASLFGGTTPVVMEALVDGTGNALSPAIYTTLFAVIGIVSVATLKETARKPLEGSPPSVSTDEEARALTREGVRTPAF